MMMSHASVGFSPVLLMLHALSMTVILIGVILIVTWEKDKTLAEMVKVVWNPTIPVPAFVRWVSAATGWFVDPDTNRFQIWAPHSEESREFS